VVLPDPDSRIKAQSLNQISAFWFNRLTFSRQNHFITATFEDFPSRLQTVSRTTGRRLMS